MEIESSGKMLVQVRSAGGSDGGGEGAGGEATSPSSLLSRGPSRVLPHLDAVPPAPPRYPVTGGGGSVSRLKPHRVLGERSDEETRSPPQNNV